MGGRAYDYRLGRFLSVDPFVVEPRDMQSLNAYSYARNNPTGRIDPTGYLDRPDWWKQGRRLRDDLLLVIQRSDCDR